jgi:hypothetical protein
MSVFVDGHLNIKSAKMRQPLEHFSDKQLEREQDPVIAKVEREQEPHGARGGEDADVAV